MIPATLLVIAKEPLPGRVKTRLCPPCTPDEAAGVARASLADTLEVVAGVSARRRVLVLDGRPGAWLPHGIEVVPQCEGGLDHRLARAFAGVDGPAFLVGMDTPQLTRALVEGALARLLVPGVDAVLGLARDGGWWGIGLRRGDARAFDGVPMSANVTGAAQLRRLAALGLRTSALPVLEDVDTFAGARAVASSVPGSRFARAVGRVEARIRRDRSAVGAGR